MDLTDARLAVRRAIDASEDLGLLMNVAVVDEGGNLIAFERQVGAWLGSISVAQNKAYTANAFAMPTADLTPLVIPGAPLYGIEHSNNGRLITFGGGVPILDADGVKVGAIGVSGDSVENDIRVAEAGASVYTS